MIEFLQQIDCDTMLAINRHHNLFWDSFMSTFSGKIIWIPMYATIVYILFKNLGWKTALLYAIGIIIAVGLADSISARLIRPFIERMRPAFIGNPISEFVHIVDGYRGGPFGFPSCHAANSFALATFTSLLFRNRWYTAFILLWATVNSYSRAYLGVHYPGDLICGAILGSLLSYASFKACSHIATNSQSFAPATTYRHTIATAAIGTITIIAILIWSAAALL